MTTQNLVSSEISTELSNSVISKLESIITDLQHVFVSLLPEDKNDYMKVGNVKLPLLDKANNLVEQHPQIMPGVFDMTEYQKDYQLSKKLVPIANKIAELNSAVQMALYAVNSDLMVSTLDIYSAALTNEDKIPGLDVQVAELREFFKRSKRIKTAPTV